MAVGAGGTSPQPRRVRPVEGLPKGKIVGIAAAIVLAVILLVVIINALVGDETITRASSPTPQTAVNPVTGQRIPPKPGNLLVTEQEYHELEAAWERWPYKGGWPSFRELFLFGVEQAEEQRLQGFCLSGHPDTGQCIGAAREIWFVRQGNGWIVTKVIP